MLLVISLVILSASFMIGAVRIIGETQLDNMLKAAKKIQEYIYVRGTVTSANSGGKDSSVVFWTLTPEARETLPILASFGDLHVIICDLNGGVILSSDSEGVAQGSYLSEDIMIHARKQGQVPQILMRKLVADTQVTISYALYLPESELSNYNEPIGYVLVSSFRRNYSLIITDFAKTWFTMVIIVLLFSAFSAYINAQRLAQPLRQMAICAHTFAHGDFSARAQVENLQDGETRELAFAFNAMADALENAEDLRRVFIANVSHELKTPMTSIAGFIGGVIDGTIPPEKREETLRMVYEEVMRLSRMVTSMTSLSRLQTGQLDLHPRVFDISDLSLRILLGLESKINEKQLEVDLDLSEAGEVYVNADLDSIVQVITNLLDNAVKFSKPGGHLGLSVRSSGGKAHIAISNEGPEIPPEDLPYIFDRFHKADRSRSHDKTGLGLGLFLVKSILYAHNEDIHVSSESGRTEFTFTLTEAKPKRQDQYYEQTD